LKELDLLSRQKPFPLQYWGLKKEESADGVSVEQADVLNGLSKLVMLDEELAQYDRELDIANG
ncbi:ATP-binding protein, partial [Pseudomonas savastanoi pv. glycinea str. race 4]